MLQFHVEEIERIATVQANLEMDSAMRDFYPIPPLDHRREDDQSDKKTSRGNNRETYRGKAGNDKNGSKKTPGDKQLHPSSDPSDSSLSRTEVRLMEAKPALKCRVFRGAILESPARLWTPVWIGETLRARLIWWCSNWPSGTSRKYWTSGRIDWRTDLTHFQDDKKKIEAWRWKLKTEMQSQEFKRQDLIQIFECLESLRCTCHISNNIEEVAAKLLPHFMNDKPKQDLVQRLDMEQRRRSSGKKKFGYDKLTTYGGVGNYLLDNYATENNIPKMNTKIDGLTRKIFHPSSVNVTNKNRTPSLISIGRNQLDQLRRGA